MELPLAANFVDRKSGARVRGVIRAAVEHDLLFWTRWRYGAHDEDRGWNWWEIYQEVSISDGRYECVAALAENKLQGLMVLDLRGNVTKARKIIVVDYLSTNPANRSTTRGLKHVGIGLMAVAIGRSIAIGTKGRIWLESLPGAAGFYEGLGMQQQPYKSAEGNLVYTLESNAAEQLLEKIRENGIVEI